MAAGANTRAHLLQLLLFHLIVLFTFCRAFNLDLATEHLKIVQGPTGSMFGFKIQSYVNTRNETMLVVSAPKLNNRVEDVDRPGQSVLVRGHGGLLVCAQNEKKCNRQFFFETKKPLLQKENRTNQNFGWSLQIGDGNTANSPEIPLIACAPMWRFRHGNVSEMTGACFLSRVDRGSDSILVDGPNTTPFYPCLYRDSENCQSSWSPVGSGQENPMREHCTCIDGFSAALIKGAIGGTGRRPKPGVVVLGSPGGTYWAGGAFAAPLHGAWMVNNEAVPDFRAISAGPKEKRDNNSFEFDNGLFGYAMAFYSVEIPLTKQQVQGVAISGIKTKALGEVVLASLSLARNEASINYFKNNSVVRGEQLSEAFGFALACGDINGDGLPEIFVGAPFFFTNITAGETATDRTARSYDSGRVYIFSTRLEEADVYAGYGPTYNLVFSEEVPVVTLDGFETLARFGSAIDYLNDINDDGYGDIVVAAPFGGANQLGVVYIYLGSHTGLTKNSKPSQAIEASKLPLFANGPVPPSTNGVRQRATMFGHTVQGRYDVDGNDYPDLLIGAIGIDTVVVIRSRPVAKIAATVSVDPMIIGSTNGHIAPSNCKGEVDETTYICASLLFCFNYSGKSLPLTMDVMLSLDADVLLTSASPSATGRAFFEGEKSTIQRRVTMRLSNKFCGLEQIQVLRSPADLLTPILFQVSLNTLPLSDPEILVPIFASGETFTKNASAEIAKDCGIDNICIPDFRIDASRSRLNYMILGDTRPFLVNFTVSNGGEEAYGGVVTVASPVGALFNGREVYEVLADGTITKLTLPDLVCSVRSLLAESSSTSASAEMILPAEINRNLPQMVTCDLPQPFRNGRMIEIRMSFSMSSLEMSGDSSAEARFNISVSSKNPEPNATLFDNRAELGLRIRPDLNINLQVFPSPEQVVYEENEYSMSVSRSFSTQYYEEQIGPHLFIEILVSNSGPTTASRVNLTARWPQDFLQNQSLLYLLEAPYLTRGRGRCVAGPPINPHRVELMPPREHKLSRPKGSSFATSSSYSTQWNDADPSTLHCYVSNLAAGDFARIVLRTRLIAKHVNMLFPSQRSFKFGAHARVVKLPTAPVVPVDVSASASANVDVVTRVADFSLAHVDLWIIAVAIGAGLLTVLLVLLSLWLAGCFDRKVRRPKPNYVKLATFEPIKTQAKRVPVVGD